MVAIGNLLNTAGNYSNSNVANTMITSTIGFVRAGTVPFDKDATKEEKAQNIIWNVTSPVASIIFQLGFYKTIEPVLKSISLKNLKYDQHKKEIASLEKYGVDGALEELSKSEKNWRTVITEQLKEHNKHIEKPSIFKRITAKLFKKPVPAEKHVTDDVIEGIEKFARKLTPEANEIGKEEVTKVLKKIKTYKGSNEFLTFVFGVVGLTSYIMPVLIVKYLNPMIKAAHDNIKINGKPIIAEPKQIKDEKEKSLVNLLGIPIIAGGAALAGLKYLTNPDNKIPFTKMKISEGFKKLGNWDAGLNPNQRLIRTIAANGIVRPLAAINQGKYALAGYLFVMEALSLAPTMIAKTFLGSVETGKGWIGKTVNKSRIKDILTSKKVPLNHTQKKGLELLMSHSVQSYLILGVALGLMSNMINKPVANFLKKVFNDNKKDDPMERLAYTSPPSQPLFNKQDYNSLNDYFTNYAETKMHPNEPLLKPNFLNFTSSTRLKKLNAKYTA